MPTKAMSDRESTAKLHPFAPPSVEIVAVEARVMQQANHVEFHYRLDGDIARLKIPALAPPARAERLWEHTCFEAFIRAGAAEAYDELNFSPSRQWAAYAFRAYRDAASDSPDWQPKIWVRHDTRRLEVVVTIALWRFSAFAAVTNLSIALSAVIESNDGQLSHWALKHPAGKPDFHHPDSFALEFALRT